MMLSLRRMRYRLATGNLPDTLADLVPTYLDAVPEDPFDGRTLRYEKLETGFVVYSVGEDKRDDGGTERLPTGKRTKAPSSWDITFIVERCESLDPDKMYSHKTHSITTQGYFWMKKALMNVEVVGL